MYSTHLLHFCIDQDLWKKKKEKRVKHRQQCSELLANTAENTSNCLLQLCSGSTVGKKYSQVSCWRKEYKVYLILQLLLQLNTIAQRGLRVSSFYIHKSELFITVSSLQQVTALWAAVVAWAIPGGPCQPQLDCDYIAVTTLRTIFHILGEHVVSQKIQLYDTGVINANF